MWTAPEKWNRTFAYHVKGYNFCLIGLLWVFRCWYLLKLLNAMGRGGWGRGLPISSYGGDWRIFGGLKFSIPGFFWLVFHLRGDFLHFHWWNRRSSRVSRVSLFFWGGVDFCPHSIILSLEIWSNAPPPPRAWELGAKKRIATFTIAQLAFAHMRQ